MSVCSRGFWNSLSTFCYLAAQRDLFGELVHGRLASEIGFLNGRAHSAEDHSANHAGDQKHPDAVDGDFYIVWWILGLCDARIG